MRTLSELRALFGADDAEKLRLAPDGPDRPMSWRHRDDGTIEPVGADGYPDEDWIARTQRRELQHDVNSALTAAGLPAIGYQPIEVEPVTVRDIEVER